MIPRPWISVAASAIVGVAALYRFPFPAGNALLELVQLEMPFLFHAIRLTYLAMLFTTPYIALSLLGSLAYILVAVPEETPAVPELPPYRNAAARDTLFLVIGEQHHRTKPRPVAAPRWLTIPERGLYTGIAVFGATGSAKTSACMYPFAEQLLAYRASDPERRIGGLVLEVKGDFCRKVQAILQRHGRGSDYLEISLDSVYRYNPLHNDLDAYALAFGIASLLNNLFGKGKEPFWQQAYTNLVKFVILLHKVLDDYVTLFDVYRGAIDSEYLERRIQEGERRLPDTSLSITFESFMALRELESFPFERAERSDRMSAPATAELRQLLDEHAVAYDTVEQEGTAGSGWTEEKCQQFEAVKRWFDHDWRRLDARLRTSVVEGISVFLSLFDDNAALKRVFCPPKATYDPVLNHDGRYGRPLPAFPGLLEQGRVCALNFPIVANPGLARTIGTLMKQDFQRAVLARIPQMDREPQRYFRQLLFLCDEYHSFATVGEDDPSGDDKFFALSRQARCVPIVATHSFSSLRSALPGESWRTLVQAFRTKVFLTLSDDFSARTASEMCGKEEQLKPQYTISEQGQDAGISVLTGKAAALRASIGASKTYTLQRDFIFDPNVFMELKNAQAIVLAYDGLSPWPPTYCYLKPYYLNPNISYFEHLTRGAL
jgi:hypothetical protein